MIVFQYSQHYSASPDYHKGGGCKTANNTYNIYYLWYSHSMSLELSSTCPSLSVCLFIPMSNIFNLKMIMTPVFILSYKQEMKNQFQDPILVLVIILFLVIIHKCQENALFTPTWRQKYWWCVAVGGKTMFHHPPLSLHPLGLSQVLTPSGHGTNI